METKRIKHPFGFEAKRPVQNPFQVSNDTYDLDQTVDLSSTTNNFQQTITLPQNTV
jgi:hypothetical protein